MNEPEPMTILYIDDDNEDQEFFYEAIGLINPSYTCISASSGRDGLKILQSLTPDHIFLDLNMPEMNGKEILLLIRSEKKFDCVPVVIFSTSIHQADITILKRNGANECMVKPVSFSILCNMLKSYLN